MRRLFLTLLLTASLVGWGAMAPTPAQAEYRLDSGDSISISVRGQPQYSFTAVVRPDGKIELPFIGRFDVKGLSTDDVADTLRPVLGRFVRHPDIWVSVSGFRPQLIYILGQVGHPGSVSLSDANLSIYDAIADAGGFTSRADETKVMLIRGQGAAARVFTVDIDHMNRTGDFSNNVVVEAGDKIMVPEVWYPNFGAIWNGVVTTVSVITTLAILVAFYNQFSTKPAGP